MAGLRTNRERLVRQSVTGDAAPPRFGASVYRISVDGEPTSVPGSGGSTYNVRLGDIVMITDSDSTFGRHYRRGSTLIGIIAHADSVLAGHGPGVTSLLTARAGTLKTGHRPHGEHRGHPDIALTLFLESVIINEIIRKNGEARRMAAAYRSQTGPLIVPRRAPFPRRSEGMSIQPYSLEPLRDIPADRAAIAALYDRIWGQFNVRTAIREDLAAPGFVGRIARAPDGDIAGYVYGLTAQVGDRAIDRIATQLAPEEAASRLFGSFFVMELAVAPEHRRQGLGATLMRAALGVCAHDRATTCTEGYNAPARALYSGLGFATLIEHMKFSPQSTAPGDDFIVLHTPLPLRAADR